VPRSLSSCGVDTDRSPFYTSPFSALSLPLDFGGRMQQFIQPLLDWRAVVEILLLAMLIYSGLRILQESMGLSVLRALVVCIVILFVVLLLVAEHFKMHVIIALLTNFPQFFALTLLIIFQPELRRALVRLGDSPILRRVFQTQDDVISTIVASTRNMAEQHIGALIALERDVPLSPYVDGGIKLDSQITGELLVTIFYPGSPLHDGAVIIRDNRLVAAGCLFPLTENPVVSRGLGTRHRAGIGLTEHSDAIAIIVSEERATVSLAVRGSINRDLTREELDQALRQIYLEKKEVQKSSGITTS